MLIEEGSEYSLIGSTRLDPLTCVFFSSKINCWCGSWVAAFVSCGICYGLDSYWRNFFLKIIFILGKANELVSRSAYGVGSKVFSRELSARSSYLFCLLTGAVSCACKINLAIFREVVAYNVEFCISFGLVFKVLLVCYPILNCWCFDVFLLYTLQYTLHYSCLGFYLLVPGCSSMRRVVKVHWLDLILLGLEFLSFINMSIFAYICIPLYFWTGSA